MHYLLAIAASFFCINIQDAVDIVFPEYWLGKVPTDYNGSTDIQTPIFMESNVYKYYRIGRDDVAINDVRKTIDDPSRIGVTIADSPPSNKPPENVTGTVSFLITFTLLIFNGDGKLKKRMKTNN